MLRRTNPRASRILRILTISSCFALVCAQQPSPETAHITQPGRLQDPPPKYPDEARKQGIQGSVAFEVTIDERGFPADITALRPLGFGLDEAARAAIEKWRWTPATKDGVPVKVTNTIVVNFRLDRANGFDERTEQNRTAFNRAVNELSASKEARERGVRKIFDLAHQQYPPAMSTVGVWEVNGENVDKNPTDGLALIQKAAAKITDPRCTRSRCGRSTGRTCRLMWRKASRR